MNFYLVQRCSFKESFDKLGSFDTNISLDYMGSAEFEFGVIPASLKNVCKNLEEMSWFKVDSVKNVNDEPIFYLAEERNNDLEEFIKAKAEGELKGNRTKEAVKLNVMASGRTDKDSIWAIHIWWLVDDEENPIMWVFGKSDRKKLDVTLWNTRMKFQDQGKI